MTQFHPPKKAYRLQPHISRPYSNKKFELFSYLRSLATEYPRYREYMQKLHPDLWAWTLEFYHGQVRSSNARFPSPKPTGAWVPEPLFAFFPWPGCFWGTAGGQGTVRVFGGGLWEALQGGGMGRDQASVQGSLFKEVRTPLFFGQPTTMLVGNPSGDHDAAGLKGSSAQRHLRHVQEISLFALFGTEYSFKNHRLMFDQRDHQH